MEYFPLDVGFLRDKKVKLLKAEFGASSVLFVLYVFCKAYEGDGYFLKWDKDDCLIAAEDLKESPAYISEVLQGCLARSLFDEGVYQMFGVLTSAGIQRRYLRGCEKRDEIEIASEYWLLDVNDKKDVSAGTRAKLAFFEVSGGKNGVNSPGNPVNSPGNPQSKGKESKGKKRKDIYKAAPAYAGDSPDVFLSLLLKDGNRYPIRESQISEWKELYPLVDIRQELRSMCGWLQGNPQKRKTKAGILRFINNWLARTQQKGGNRYGGAGGTAAEHAGSPGSGPEAAQYGEHF